MLSYNIHKGFSAGNRRFVLHQIREAIQGLEPDFVFLQEARGGHAEFLAESAWAHFAYGRNAVYRDGYHGNAILSRYPILEWENEDVSSSGIERRGLLHAVVAPTGHATPLHLICVHLGLIERDRQRQTDRLCARMNRTIRCGQGAIVAGDFNDWTLTLSAKLRKEAGLEEAFEIRHARHARTFPARMPLLRLDRIYFQGFKPSGAKCLHSGPWARLSDHAALLVEFERDAIAEHPV